MAASRRRAACARRARAPLDRASRRRSPRARGRAFPSSADRCGRSRSIWRRWPACPLASRALTPVRAPRTCSGTREQARCHGVTSRSSCLPVNPSRHDTGAHTTLSISRCDLHILVCLRVGVVSSTFSLKDARIADDESSDRRARRGISLARLGTHRSRTFGERERDMLRRLSLIGLNTALVFGLVVLAASRASAQSAAGITGVVKDATGGVLPGVTVEASSPALLEKVRTAVTDGQGLYSFTDLRPGTYEVTFTLTGFNAVRRDGIVLTTSFTATVNVEMSAGNIQETITVSGAGVDRRRHQRRPAEGIHARNARSLAGRIQVVERRGRAGARRETDGRAERRRHRLVERDGGHPRRRRRGSHHAARRDALQPGQRFWRRPQRLQRKRRHPSRRSRSRRRRSPRKSRPAASSATSCRKKAATSSRRSSARRSRTSAPEQQPGRRAQGARHPVGQLRRPDLRLQPGGRRAAHARTSCGSTRRSGPGASTRASPARISTRRRTAASTRRT